LKGRPKDPTRTRRQTGNRRKPNEPPAMRAVPAIVDRVPPPPEDLAEEAQAIWRILAAELEPKGLGPGDYEALRQMVTAAHRAREAARNITKYGLIVEGQRGPMVNPLVKLERDATLTYLKLAEQYGLTLASRLRLGMIQLQGSSLLSTLQSQLEE